MTSWLHSPALAAAFLVVDPAGSAAPVHSREPSPVMAPTLQATGTPEVLVSPDRTRLLLMDPAPLRSTVAAGAPELHLAGVRLDPATHAPAHAKTFTSLVIQPLRGDTRRIVLPWESRVLSARWAPDGQSLAFTLVEAGGISLWVADASSGDIRLLLGPVLNGAFGDPCQWLPSGSGLLCSRVPADRVGEPDRDEALFEHFFTGQLLTVPLSGTPRLVGSPGIHSRVALSPDGKYLLVETLHPPFPSLVPWPRFGVRSEVWELSGQVVLQIADRPLQDSDPGSADAVPSGPRSPGWRGDAPATLFWLEALDGGNPTAEVSVRDRLQALEAPFTGEPVAAARLMHRGREVIWARSDLAIVIEEWLPSRKMQTSVIDPGHPAQPPRILFERSREDRSADPGQFLTVPTPGGEVLLLTSKDGQFGFLAGTEESIEGGRPFLDRIELGTGRTRRIFRSEAPGHEEVVAMLDRDAGRIITRREGGGSPPNYFVRDLRKGPSARLTQLTQFKLPAP